MPVSRAQLFTLRRMRNGTRYMMRGDKGYGIEVRYDVATGNRDDVSCRSLAPLMRSGLIRFKTKPTDMTRYYEVELTPQGVTAAKGNIQ
ncbi:hypothetical protein JJB79_16405 [Pantoea eucrina]|uniref:Uncharacterized protein n=2 Tax=Pantoea eucrina TaxID=472693 RepID=A0ABS1Z950_9GAMM|nr:hypothetical protein [Pantoea eucrina]QNH53336.1 hypothetical protein HWI77_19205 [Acinetobacter venetianus]